MTADYLVKKVEIKFAVLLDICINYAELAEDVYDFQFEESKKRVSLKWGQDFYRDNKEDNKDE